MRAVLQICSPTCLRGMKDCVILRLNVKRKSVYAYIGGSGLETLVMVLFEIDEIEDDARGGSADSQVTQT